MASPNLSELITTTARHRSGQLADNVSKSNALLSRLSAKGKMRGVSGGRTIVEELEYAENATFKYYSGYEVLDIAPSDVISAAEYNWKQAAVVVSASGLEVDVQNAGKEQIINLLGTPLGVRPGGTPAAQGPSTKETNQVHGAIPVDAQGNQGECNGIDIGVGQHGALC